MKNSVYSENINISVHLFNSFIKICIGDLGDADGKQKTDKTFLNMYGGYLCTFIPAPSSITSLSDVKEDAELNNVFVYSGTQYYEVFGKVGTFRNWSSKNKTFSRDYSYRYFTTSTDAEGNEIKEEHIEQRKQSITVPTWKFAPLEGEYLEGYYILTEISKIAGVVKDKLLCLANGHLCWRLQDGTYESFGLATALDMGNYILDVGYDAENLYVLISTKDKTIIANGNVSDMNVIDGAKISNALTPKNEDAFSIDQKYHDEHAEREKEYLGDMAGIDAAERLEAEKF